MWPKQKDGTRTFRRVSLIFLPRFDVIRVLLIIIIRCSGMFRDVPGCSGMFRDVPGCSGMFRYVPECSGMTKRYGKGLIAWISKGSWRLQIMVWGFGVLESEVTQMVAIFEIVQCLKSPFPAGYIEVELRDRYIGRREGKSFVWTWLLVTP